MFQLDADGRARYDMSVRATKHGTDAPASGTAILGVKDLDQVGGYGPEFAESVELLSGYGPDVYLTPDCTVSVTNGNRKFTATAEDNETYRAAIRHHVRRRGHLVSVARRLVRHRPARAVQPVGHQRLGGHGRQHLEPRRHHGLLEE